jgi:hypothetical protein
MIKLLSAVVLLTLAACTTTAPVKSDSACAVNRASYACQVEEYSKAGM